MFAYYDDILFKLYTEVTPHILDNQILSYPEYNKKESEIFGIEFRETLEKNGIPQNGWERKFRSLKTLKLEIYGFKYSYSVSSQRIDTFLERPIVLPYLQKPARDPEPGNLTCFSENTQNVKDGWEISLSLKNSR